MKLGSFFHEGAGRLAMISESGCTDVSRHWPEAPSNLLQVILDWPAMQPRFEKLSAVPPDFAPSEKRWLAPIQRPGKIFAIGLNYADHCAEAGLPIPKEQVWFSKAVTSIAGPFDPIELPAASAQLDYECEMVAVIGKLCRNVPASQAKKVIFGFCVGNDVSVRDFQLRTSQWTLGKSFDTHAPIGPWVTTAEDVDPHALDIQTLVNGELRQHSNTRNLIFDTYRQIEQLSGAMTLEPGDLIFTGTCGGVGMSHNPPLWLKKGDVVSVEIGQLGEIKNRVVPGPTKMRCD